MQDKHDLKLRNCFGTEVPVVLTSIQAFQGLVGCLSILTPRRDGWVDNGHHHEGRCHQQGLKGVIAVGGLLVTILRKQTQLQQSQI